MEVTVGQRYKHYKGKEYSVIAIGRHSETLEELVVYQAEYTDPQFGEKAIWVRPLSMFSEVITVGENKVSRFTLIE